MSMTGRLRDVLLRGEPGVDADTLIARIDALGRFTRASRSHLPADRLRPAEAVIARAGDRLALSRDHTVVALAGATGSGKSSLFNALAGLELSTVGFRRPTTGVAHACVWQAEGTADLLDWLERPEAAALRAGECARRRRPGDTARSGPARPARLRLDRGRAPDRGRPATAAWSTSSSGSPIHRSTPTR